MLQYHDHRIKMTAAKRTPIKLVTRLLPMRSAPPSVERLKGFPPPESFFASICCCSLDKAVVCAAVLDDVLVSKTTVSVANTVVVEVGVGSESSGPRSVDDFVIVSALEVLDDGATTVVRPNVSSEVVVAISDVDLDNTMLLVVVFDV